MKLLTALLVGIIVLANLIWLFCKTGDENRE
jgi:hypothetical protein